jgi:hypothetical protein
MTTRQYLRPPWAARVIGGRMARLFKPQVVSLVSVPGRTTGTWHSTPVAVLQHGGQEYLLSAYGTSAPPAPVASPGAAGSSTSPPTRSRRRSCRHSSRTTCDSSARSPASPGPSEPCPTPPTIPPSASPSPTTSTTDGDAPGLDATAEPWPPLHWSRPGAGRPPTGRATGVSPQAFGRRHRSRRHTTDGHPAFPGIGAGKATEHRPAEETFRITDGLTSWLCFSGKFHCAVTTRDCQQCESGSSE